MRYEIEGAPALSRFSTTLITLNAHQTMLEQESVAISSSQLPKIHQAIRRTVIRSMKEALDSYTVHRDTRTGIR